MFEGLKVLYLEDEPLVAMDTGAHLQTLGFETLEVAYKLAAAQELADRARFDLAILDINVDRGQTSIALGSALKNAGTAVIFASGNGTMANDLCRDGFEFLDKPFSLHALTAKLKQVVQDQRISAV
ncbi:response regulator [uncultured Tateyamaria sp.]|uniref:response regulator n=1 Tax=uncultured Tateyamaria sp. TaxID=455651 RepID=UPI00263044D7|nr:response regulator [uncultured Tateyamaria sp.]